MHVTAERRVLSARLYLASTDGAVPWIQLSEIKTGYPPLAPRERCEIFLRAVNGELVKIRDWNRLVGVPLLKGLAEDVHVELFKEPLPFRLWLNRIIEDPETAFSERGAQVNALMLNGAYFIFPEVEFTDGVRITRERVIARTLDAALQYALNLFFDPELQYGRQLRKCSWQECGKFALSEASNKPGQPRSFFCDDSHRKRETLRQTAERVAAKRAGMTVEKWRAKQARKHK